MNSVAEKSYEAPGAQQEGRTRIATGSILFDHREAPPDRPDRPKPARHRAVAYGCSGRTPSASCRGTTTSPDGRPDRVVEGLLGPSTDPARAPGSSEPDHAATDVRLTQPEWAVLERPAAIESAARGDHARLRTVRKAQPRRHRCDGARRPPSPDGYVAGRGLGAAGRSSRRRLGGPVAWRSTRPCGRCSTTWSALRRPANGDPPHRGLGRPTSWLSAPEGEGDPRAPDRVVDGRRPSRADRPRPEQFHTAVLERGSAGGRTTTCSPGVLNARRRVEVGSADREGAPRLPRRSTPRSPRCSRVERQVDAIAKAWPAAVGGQDPPLLTREERRGRRPQARARLPEWWVAACRRSWRTAASGTACWSATPPAITHFPKATSAPATRSAGSSAGAHEPAGLVVRPRCAAANHHGFRSGGAHPALDDEMWRIFQANHLDADPTSFDDATLTQRL